ncbi:MAG: hypothetical protein Q7V14_01125 [Coriobacteriia bacterium]|nr:hypothetical protein [Coriobacteriia bacterium]
MARNVGFPSFAARKNWGKYSAGILTEVVLILGWMLLVYMLAVAAQWVR